MVWPEEYVPEAGLIVGVPSAELMTYDSVEDVAVEEAESVTFT